LTGNKTNDRLEPYLTTAEILGRLPGSPAATWINVRLKEFVQEPLDVYIYAAQITDRLHSFKKAYPQLSYARFTQANLYFSHHMIIVFTLAPQTEVGGVQRVK
jgi:hypothetical protein